MRGYHTVNHHLPGWDKGTLPNSFYYVMNVLEMHKYDVVHTPFFAREFPAAWTDIDKSIGNLPHTH